MGRAFEGCVGVQIIEALDKPRNEILRYAQNDRAGYPNDSSGEILRCAQNDKTDAE